MKYPVTYDGCKVLWGKHCTGGDRADPPSVYYLTRKRLKSDKVIYGNFKKQNEHKKPCVSALYTDERVLPAALGCVVSSQRISGATTRHLKKAGGLSEACL